VSTPGWVVYTCGTSGRAGQMPRRSQFRLHLALMPQSLLVCLPDRLHPVSQMFLEHWLAGHMTTAEFLRWFHMPNSSYLPVAQCILAAVAGS